MSNFVNDALLDRLADLMPYVTPETAHILETYIKDGDLGEAYEFLNALEAVYADDLLPEPNESLARNVKAIMSEDYWLDNLV